MLVLMIWGFVVTLISHLYFAFEKKPKQTLLGKAISLNHVRVIYAPEKIVCQQNCYIFY